MPECSRICQNVQEYARMFKNMPEYSKIFQKYHKVPEYSRI
jgi:hypothetical protein